MPRLKSFDYNLESLRGFAALFVVIHHIIFYSNYLDPHYFPSVLRFLEPSGHLCVLIFFVLSGYVIGMSNKQNLNANQILPYLKRRFIRLYPIYLICILFTLLISHPYPIKTIVGNLSFTQVLLTPVLFENNPIWSLHYEALFYLLFIPISFFRINSAVAACLCLISGVCSSVVRPDYPMLSSYLLGFTFWLSGLVIARYFTQKEKLFDYRLLVSYLFLILCLAEYNILTRIINKTSSILSTGQNNSTDFYKSAISMLDLSFLPYCFLFVLIFSGKKFRYRKPIMLALQLLPLLSLYRIPGHIASNTIGNFIGMSVFYLASLIFFFFPMKFLNTFSEKIVSFGIKAGALSYAIYLLHLPILNLFRQIDFSSGTLGFFILRLVIFFVVLFIAAYLLEKKFQPWIKKAFMSRLKKQPVLSQPLQEIELQTVSAN